MDDVARMFYDLCLEFREAYLNEVVANGMKERFFIECFISSRKHMDCKRPLCRNAHSTNLVAIRLLFENRMDLVRKYLLAERFTEEESRLLISEMYYGRSPSLPLFRDSVLGHRLSDEQMIRIAACANVNCLFFDCVLSIETVRDFFDCRPGLSLCVNNLRRVALLFGMLEQHELLDYGWQKVIAARKMLYSKKGIPITATGLSSALSAAKIHSSLSVYKSISLAMAELAKMQTRE